MTAEAACSTAGKAVQQLIFRREFDGLLPVDPVAGQTFFLSDRLVPFLLRLPKVVRTCGLVEALKGCVRVTRGRQFLYGVQDGSHIVHYGWVTRGVCRHYEIEKEAFVIGPIWSSPNHRGKGAATYATKRAINEVARRGGRIVYIDTAENNFPCLRVIEKCSFGSFVSSYDRHD